MGLSAEGDLGTKGIELALADGRDEGGDAVPEVGLARPTRCVGDGRRQTTR